MTSGERFALGSLIAGCLVLGLKGAAWWVTGSAALYSDALESIVNVAASLIAWMALRLAARPADANHPYGHDKAEFFAAVIEGVLIMVAALLIFEEAWQGWWQVRTLDAPFRGIALNATATMINAVWSSGPDSGRPAPAVRGAGSRRATLVGRRGDLGWHRRRFVPGGVHRTVHSRSFAGRGYRNLRAVVRRADDFLLGQRPHGRRTRAGGGEADQGGGREQCGRRDRGARPAYKRHAGRLTFLEFHLVVPGSMTVAIAHQICDRIEDALKAEMGYLMITIHVEPEEKAKQGGVPVL